MRAEADKIGFVSDPKLVPRIRQIVESDSAQPYLDAEEIATSLQQRHPEYARKKRRAFVLLVQRALDRLSNDPTFRPDRTPLADSTKNRKRKADKSPRSRASTPGEVIVLDAQANSSDDDAVNNPNYRVYPDTNLANSSLTALYKQRTPSASVRNSPAPSRPTTPRDPEQAAFFIDRKPSANMSEKSAKTAAKKSLPRRLTSSGLASIPELTTIPERPTVSFKDLGGCEAQFLDVCRLSMHLKHPEIHAKLGVTPPRGFLLHGPPGCGKTLFAQAVAGELDLPLIRIASTELVSGVSGESEEKIRQLFAKAAGIAPCVLFLDEIDAIAPKRETAQREMERRIVSQLITCLDDLGKNPSNAEACDASDKGEEVVEEGAEKRGGNHVLVIGATNRPDSLEPALRRAGRFDREIALGIPDESSRMKILQVVCKGLRVDASVDLRHLARLTPGYVGADLTALAREGSMCAVNRIFETVVRSSTGISSAQDIREELDRILRWLKSEDDLDESKLNDLFVTMADFKQALTSVHPSAKREGFATVPGVTWADVGALKAVRDELEWSILYPIKKPEEFEAFALTSKPQGVLLCGPPGCGKTLLAKAVANETGMNFISVKGPELLSMYVGESERAVRTVFQRARDSAPCVIFFDEIDALCPKRSESETAGGARLVNQLLTEMDGIEARKQVFLIGATNRPDIVDPAILRPGRLDKILFVGFPSVEDRADILRAVTKIDGVYLIACSFVRRPVQLRQLLFQNGSRPKLAAEVSLDEIAADSHLEWFTGADLAALVREACVAALKEKLQSKGADDRSEVRKDHFIEAMKNVRSSVGPTDRLRYEALRQTYSLHLK